MTFFFFQAMASQCSNEVGSEIRFMNRNCYCGRKASIRISETKRNPKKLFYKCDKCNFFAWWDEGSSSNFVNHHAEESEIKEALGRVSSQVERIEAKVNGIRMGIILIIFLLCVCLLMKI